MAAASSVWRYPVRLVRRLGVQRLAMVQRPMRAARPDAPYLVKAIAAAVVSAQNRDRSDGLVVAVHWLEITRARHLGSSR
jgi:hypothetical protein